MPRVSVIVPIFNVEQYLRECMESIINQTLQDIEIICVNDGSTDNSLSIIQEYALKDSRIKVINKTNTGYGHSMNTGLDMASGEYIGIVESDDFATPDMFAKLYDVAEKNSAQVVKSNYFEYRSYLDIKEKFMENLGSCTYNRIFCPMDEQNVFFVAASIWSGIYNRSFLVNNNIRFNETPGASFQDTSFAFKVWASAVRVYLIKDAFLYYRRENMDSSVNSASKIFCICDEYEEMERFLDNHQSQRNKLSSLAFTMKFRAYKGNYSILVSAFQYTFLLKMAEEFRNDERNGIINLGFLDNLEVDEINRIKYKTTSYFKETAKEYRDDRLSLTLNLTLNSKFYMDGFLDCIRKYQNVIIFGAGIIGRIVAQKLLYEEKLSNVSCFAVSDLIGNPESLFGIPVLCIRDLYEKVDSSIVLVATKEQDQYDIVKLLRSLSFNNLVVIDSKLLKSLND